MNERCAARSERADRPPEPRGPRGTALSRLRRLAREVATFGAVGAIGFLVNVGVFNLCMHTFQLAPIRSGVLSQVVAIATNYLGNRYWTYRDTDKNRVRRETTLFFVFSGIALVVENSVLAVSHYGFGFTSALADNVAKNVIGLGIGTVFRFWSYRTWVFKAAPAAPQEAPGDIAGAVRAARPAPATPQSAATSASSAPAPAAGRRSRRAVSAGRTAARGLRHRRSHGLAAQEEGEYRRVLL